jgi:hypothetical protein
MRHEFTKEELAKAEELRPYENKWVALVDDKVVAAGDSPDEVAEKAEQAGYREYAFHLVPPFDKHFIPTIFYK